MQLSIIIVSYNVKYFLEQCLCSVSKAIAGIDAEILVIDNCSQDNSIEYLQPLFPFVNFISNNTNEGFAKANNLALKKCSGEFILFLNPDTLLAEDALDECINFLKGNANAGAAGVKMIDGRGKFLPESKRSFPSPLVSFFKLSGLSSLFPRSKFFNRYALGYLGENKIHEVDVLSGAFMMVRKNILEQLNGFDEDFFMYGEDVDLSYRIQQSGFANFYLGNICILHFKGGSTKRGSLNYVHMFYNAMIVFVKKHYTGKFAWVTNLLLHTAIYLRGLLSLLAQPFRILFNFFSKKNIDTAQNYLLAGDGTSATEAALILEKNNIRSIKISLEELPQKISSAKSTIVFCMGELTFKQTFELMNHTGAKANFKWHCLHAKSIAGSNFENLRGEVFSNS